MAGGVNFDAPVDSQADIDLLKVTLKAYPRAGMLSVVQDLHSFPIMNRIFKSDRLMIRAGKSISERLMIDENGSAKMVQPYEIHEDNVVDVMATMELPWRQAQASWTLEKGEILRNQDGSMTKGHIAQLVDLMKPRRASSDLSLANMMEDLGWEPPTSSSDVLNPWGIFYWLVPITSAQVAAGSGGDHIGANPTGFTTTAGIDASQDKYRLWRSYNDVWDADPSLGITITDAEISKMVRMHRRLKFQTPMNARDWQSDSFADFQAYCSEARLEALETRARANNESLGADLGKFSGQTVIKGTPLNWVEKIDDVTSDPLVLLNHKHVHAFILEGDNFTETVEGGGIAQHRVTVAFTDVSFNFGTMNRRLMGGRIDYVA
jgi:hypothetical protein